MALQQISVAAATAVVEYNLLRDAEFRVAARPRKIVSAGVAGSAAALDTLIRLEVGTDAVAKLYNSATGAVTRDHMFRVGAYVPAGVEVRAIVVDAPATNPINLTIDMIEV